MARPKVVSRSALSGQACASAQLRHVWNATEILYFWHVLCRDRGASASQGGRGSISHPPAVRARPFTCTRLKRLRRFSHQPVLGMLMTVATLQTISATNGGSQMATNGNADLVPISEVGDRLGISLRAAYRASARGDVPSFRVGRRWFVPRKSFDSLLRGDRVMAGRGCPAVTANSEVAA